MVMTVDESLPLLGEFSPCFRYWIFDWTLTRSGTPWPLEPTSLSRQAKFLWLAAASLDFRQGRQGQGETRVVKSNHQTERSEHRAE